MIGLFGKMPDEKRRGCKDGSMDRDIMFFLESCKKYNASLQEIAKHLKLPSHHAGLQHCLNVMRQKGNIEYDVLTMKWFIVRRFYGD